MDNEALAARIEAADESQTWEMLEDSAEHIWGIDKPDSRRRKNRRRASCNAYIDAAMMLVAEGWKPSRIVWLYDVVEFSMHKGFASATGRHATSLPLAIAAAAVRAAG